MVTALVVQLIQSCCSGSALVDSAQETLNDLIELSNPLGSTSFVGYDLADSQETNEPISKKVTKDPTTGMDIEITVGKDQIIIEKFLAAAKAGADSSAQAAGFFLQYLISRSFQSNPEATASRRKSMGATTESEHKLVLENFLKDIILLLGELEWPGADLVAVIFSKLMVRSALWHACHPDFCSYKKIVDLAFG
jgi:hypothetical protein